MEKHIAACGLDCSKCPIPKINKDWRIARSAMDFPVEN
jgi:hypothetical protein